MKRTYTFISLVAATGGAFIGAGITSLFLDLNWKYTLAAGLSFFGFFLLAGLTVGILFACQDEDKIKTAGTMSGWDKRIEMED